MLCLCSPLNGVLGTASLLAETTKLDYEQKDYVRVIQSSGEHLLIVLNDILDFSKFESGKLEIDAGRVDVQQMLEQAIELSFKPKPALELVYSIAPDVPPFVLGDATRLRQICANMISNASKFTDQGHILIRVERMSSAEIRAQQHKHMQLASQNFLAHQAGATPVDADADATMAAVGASPSTNSASPEIADSAAAAPQPMDVVASAGRSRRSPSPSPVLPASSSSSSAAVHSSTLSAQARPASKCYSPFLSSTAPPGLSAESLLAHSHSDDPDSMLLVFSVTDTGIGIDPTKIHRLFSAFTQLDVSITREYGGTGQTA